jgi:hypothetical protein
MTTPKNNPVQDLFRIYNLDRCAEMISGMSDSVEDINVEAFIRALLPIYELSKDAGTIEATSNLMRAAYNRSGSADGSFDRYLNDVRSSMNDTTAEPREKANEDFTQNPNGQGFVYVDDEERGHFIEQLLTHDDLSVRRETLAETLITLREALDEQSPLIVSQELNRMIDLLFEKSKVYALTREMYGRRYHMSGDETLERTVEDLYARTLGTEAAGREPKQRPDIAGTIYAGDQARVLILHRLLSADDEDLNRMLHMLEKGDSEQAGSKQ